jgi:hypothetical protein
MAYPSGQYVDASFDEVDALVHRPHGSEGLPFSARLAGWTKRNFLEKY